MDAKQLLLLASVVATGLMAGLFYGWSVSVIPGTRRIASGDYISLMKHINREILTPRFLLLFIGIPIILGVAAISQFRAGDRRRAALLTASAVTYLIGVFGVTAAGNVPLNDALDTFDLTAMSAEHIEQRRQSYEHPWNRLNTVRAVANVVAFALATSAAVLAEHTE